MRVGRALGIASLVLVLAACGPPSSPASPAGSAAPSAGTGLPVGYPPACAPIDLRSPSGEIVDLTGEWAGSGVLTGTLERVWLLQIGDCVFGTVLGENFLGVPRSAVIRTNLEGHIHADYTIDTDVVVVAQHPEVRFADFSQMVLLITWGDDGRIELHEDRSPEEVAGRCRFTAENCEPVVWYRVDEPLAPSPS